MSSLRDAISRTAGQAPRPSSSGSRTDGPAPTCNNCRTDTCNRCPTAIENHGRSGWTSDFPECACYTADPDRHANLVEQDDDEYYENGPGHGYWGAGDY